MSSRFWSQALALLTVALLLSGCSTMIVQDNYRVADKETRFLEFRTDGVELLTGFNPDIRFYSIGVLGVPVIPTNVSVSDPSEINLAIELTLHHDFDFSFLTRPCLVVKSSKPLCPDNLTISAVALYQDDGLDDKKTWHKVSDFYNTGEMKIVFPAASESVRIGRERVYSHYGYSGEEKWHFLRIDITYNYKCKGTCPESLVLDTKGLVAIENTTIPEGNYSFTKTRDKEYRFITAPGP